MRDYIAPYSPGAVVHLTYYYTSSIFLRRILIRDAVMKSVKSHNAATQLNNPPKQATSTHSNQAVPINKSATLNCRDKHWTVMEIA